MVFRKGATAAKNATPKGKGKKALPVTEADDDDLNMFEDMEDSDDDSGSEEEMPVQKTPNKGKARQSLSEKKVSFQIPGKKTPGKTPKKDDSLIVKKQATPGKKGKTEMQEFLGMKANKKQAPQVEEDEDDDDDEEDEDFEADLDDDDDDLDMDEDDDDEEEEDEDDDDDDEEDDDEEEEDDKNDVKQKLANLKQKSMEQNKQKTPVKANDKAKKGETPIKTEQTPNLEKEKTNSKNVGMVNPPNEIKRRRERDLKTLYLGNLPRDVTTDELKALSKDIEEVIIPHRAGRATHAFAFLLFPSEGMAESNLKVLNTKKFRGQPLKLDFVGEKSQNKKPSQEVQQNIYNMKKLYVTGIPVETTIAQVAAFFPLAYQISFNHSPLYRTASIAFDTDEQAGAAFDENKEILIDGHKLVVLHSQMSKGHKRKNHRMRHKKANGQGGPPVKRMKKSDDE